jgi:hypothetical protein
MRKHHHNLRHLKPEKKNRFVAIIPRWVGTTHVLAEAGRNIKIVTDRYRERSGAFQDKGLKAKDKSIKCRERASLLLFL